MNVAASKAERLALAGRLAPALRQASKKRVKVYSRKRFDETGEIVVKDETTVGVVQEAAAKAAELEIDVLHPEEWCSGYPVCRKKTPRWALSPSRVAKRGGNGWTCTKCQGKRRRVERAKCAKCGARVSIDATRRAALANRKVVYCNAHRGEHRRASPEGWCATCGKKVSRGNSVERRLRNGEPVYCRKHYAKSLTRARCEICQKVLSRASSRKSRVCDDYSPRCKKHSNVKRLPRQTECAGGCGARPPQNFNSPARVKQRRGPWRCRSCASKLVWSTSPNAEERKRALGAMKLPPMTPEKRSTVSKRMWASKTPEERQEVARKRVESRLRNAAAKKWRGTR